MPRAEVVASSLTFSHGGRDLLGRLLDQRTSTEVRDGLGPAYAELLRLRLSECVDDGGLADLMRSRTLAEAAGSGAWFHPGLHALVVASLVREGRPIAALDSFDSASYWGVDHSDEAYVAAIHACAQSDQVERARGMLDDLTRRAEETACPVPASAFDFAMLACAARAESLAALPRSRRVELRRLCVDTDPASVVQDVAAVLRRMEELGLRPSTRTHLAVLRALAAAGQARGALAVVEVLLRRRLGVDESHFALVIDALGRRARRSPGDEELLLAEAEGAFAAAVDVLGRAPGHRLLRSVLRAYCGNGRMQRATDWLDREYAAHGCVPAPECFVTLLDCARVACRPDWALATVQRARAAGVDLDGTRAAEILRAIVVRWRLGGLALETAGYGQRGQGALRALSEELQRHPGLEGVMGSAAVSHARWGQALAQKHGHALVEVGGHTASEAAEKRRTTPNRRAPLEEMEALFAEGRLPQGLRYWQVEPGPGPRPTCRARRRSPKARPDRPQTRTTSS